MPLVEDEINLSSLGEFDGETGARIPLPSRSPGSPTSTHASGATLKAYTAKAHGMTRRSLFTQPITARQDATCPTVEVLEPFEPANVTATCSATVDTVFVGDPMDYTIEITNDNEVAADVTVEVSGAGDSNSGFTTVPAGGTETVTLELVPQQATTFDAEVGLTVEEA